MNHIRAPTILLCHSSSQIRSWIRCNWFSLLRSGTAEGNGSGGWVEVLAIFSLPDLSRIFAFAIRSCDSAWSPWSSLIHNKHSRVALCTAICKVAKAALFFTEWYWSIRCYFVLASKLVEDPSGTYRTRDVGDERL
jgi:hypothetical protein